MTVTYHVGVTTEHVVLDNNENIGNTAGLQLQQSLMWVWFIQIQMVLIRDSPQSLP